MKLSLALSVRQKVFLVVLLLPVIALILFLAIGGILVLFLGADFGHVDGIP